MIDKKLAVVKKITRKPEASVIEMLEKYLDKAKRGEITRLGVMFEQEGDEWGTEFSATEDCRIDAAMMMELAMRRIGFKT